MNEARWRFCKIRQAAKKKITRKKTGIIYKNLTIEKLLETRTLLSKKCRGHQILHQCNTNIETDSRPSHANVKLWQIKNARQIKNCDKLRTQSLENMNENLYKYRPIFISCGSYSIITWTASICYNWSCWTSYFDYKFLFDYNKQRNKDMTHTSFIFCTWWPAKSVMEMMIATEQIRQSPWSFGLTNPFQQTFFKMQLNYKHQLHICINNSDKNNQISTWNKFSQIQEKLTNQQPS